jgi:hypothetical protein
MRSRERHFASFWSTYQQPMKPSMGMKFVIVGRTVLIEQGKLVPNTFPGKPPLGPGRP